MHVLLWLVSETLLSIFADRFFPPRKDNFPVWPQPDCECSKCSAATHLSTHDPLITKAISV